MDVQTYATVAAVCARLTGRLSDDVPVTDEVPPPAYRVTATGPASAPDPSRADAVLSAGAAAHGGARLVHAWREPLPGAPDGERWLVVAGGDPPPYRAAALAAGREVWSV
jgi:hypothetical protein